jgi:hypothetical protein
MFFAFAGITISLMMGIAGGSFAQENQTTSLSSSQGTDNLSSTSFSASNLTTTGNTSSPISTTNDNTTVSTTDRNTLQNGSAKEASGPLDPIMNLFK